LREAGDAEALEHESERVLMLIKRGRTIALFDLGTNDHPLDLPAAVCAVGTLIEHDNQHTVAAGLKHISVEQRRDVGV